LSGPGSRVRVRVRVRVWVRVREYLFAIVAKLLNEANEHAIYPSQDVKGFLCLRLGVRVRG
jgi:hypothetical protein